MSEQNYDAETSRRKRQGAAAAILSVVWWVVSIGGVITVITLQS